MSTTARGARLRQIWNFQNHLNVTRARLLASMSAKEHLRFAAMYPLPYQDDDELRRLMLPKEEVLEEIQRAEIGSGGWGAGKDFSRYLADRAEVDPSSDESSWGEESDYGSDGDVGESDVDEVLQTDVNKPEDDSGVVIYSSDGSRCSPKLPPTINSPDADPTFTCNFNDSDPGSPGSPNPTEAEQDTPQTPVPPAPTSNFALNLLCGTTTAEMLLSFEEAYGELYHAGASVWRSTRRLEDRRYEGFMKRQMRDWCTRGASKLQNEVLVEDLEGCEWMYGRG